MCVRVAASETLIEATEPGFVARNNSYGGQALLVMAFVSGRSQ